jgi:hypothetical protein
MPRLTPAQYDVLRWCVAEAARQNRAEVATDKETETVAEPFETSETESK